MSKIPPEFAEALARMELARAAIIAQTGKWVKGKSDRGKVDCPVCGTAGSLHYSRAGINGHIHATCRTDKCVSWME